MIRNILLATVALSAAPAAAQDVSSHDAQTSGQVAENGASDIVVTADVQAKVIEAGPLGTLDILTTPYSVNSVAADTIELRQTRTLIELQKTDPSAQLLTNAFGVAFIGIRGFPADVRLDGTRTSTSSQFPLEFVDRIDVVKGASSFLYGFAAPGGVVDYALKRPQPDAFVTATASYRSKSDLLGRIDVNQPITDRLGVRINALHERGETFLDDDRQRRTAIGGAVDWRPTDSVLLRGDFTWQRNAPKSGGSAIFFVLPGVDVPSPPSPRTRYAQKWERFRVNLYAYGLRGDWTFAPDWTLSLRARGFTQPRAYYSTGAITVGPGETLTNSVYGFNDGQNSYQQQAKINGKLVTGALEHHLTVAFDRQFDPTFTGTGFTFVPVDTGTIADPIDAPRPADFGLPHDPRYRVNRTLQYAGTIADRIEAGPWTALLALRYVDFSLHAFDAATGDVATRNDVTRVTPTIGLSRALGDGYALYASYAQGLEPGATPPVSAANPAPVPLGPVGSDQFEFGAKAKLGGLTATAAVFHLRRDYQGATVLADGVTPGFIDDGKQVHNGAEVNLSGRIARGWNVIAGATYLDAKIRDAQGFAINGDRPVGVARFQSTLFVEHEVQPGLFVNASAFHASGSEIDSPNDRRIEGYTTIDGGVRWVGDVGGRVVSVNANVENVFDKRYYGGVYFGFLSLSVPRQFKLTVSSGF